MTSKGLRTVVIVYLLAGCAPEEGDPAQGSSTIESLDRDLSVGSRGEDVQAVNSYLARFGYFPNAELQRSYSNWRPIVPESPAQDDVYDSQTAQAIRELQRTHSLHQTGIVDAATRDVLKQSRCGTPDGIDLGDGSEKFSLGTVGWGKDGLTWRVFNADDVTLAEARSAAAAAFAQWVRPTKHTFTQITSGTPDIAIEFATNQSPGVPFGPNGLAAATYPLDGGDIRLNVAKSWSVATTTPSGKVDLNSVLVHEIGHTLGIAHSGMQTPTAPATAVMFGLIPDAVQRRVLTPDDHVAGLTRVIKWGEFDSSTRDVSVYDHQNGQDLFVTGGAAVSGGREIWQRVDGTTWTLLPGGAVRISANKDALPWIVNNAGAIFSWNSGTRNWDADPSGACAMDIAVGPGPNPAVWAVSCTAVTGGFRIMKKRTGVGWDLEAAGKGGLRISVGPQKPGGVVVPWITDTPGKIHRRSSGDPSTGSWEEMPGLGKDIAVSGSGYAWLVSAGSTTGGFTVYSLDEQPSGPGSPPAPALQQWIRVPGAAINVATSWLGYPIISNNVDHAFEPL